MTARKEWALEDSPNPFLISDPAAAKLSKLYTRAQDLGNVSLFHESPREILYDIIKLKHQKIYSTR